MTFTCYNKGCGASFTDEDNSDDACSYHPGVPVFHDAYKGWSCCKKRSTDFTEFLSIPGCIIGRHNHVKPVEPTKNIEKPLDVGEVITNGVPQMMKQKVFLSKPTERPSDEIEKVKLQTTVASSLKTDLQKLKEKGENKVNAENSDSDVVAIGASCKHNACDSKYLGECNSANECTFHPGYPVFHEGYKFWSCCNKRTSDFDEFLKQVGCEVGKHEWMKISEVIGKRSACRYDWHQTGSYVLVTIYAKVCDPEKCFVEVNPTNMHAVIAFNGGISLFELQIKLHEAIDPALSSVEFMSAKAEIKLKKKESFSWPQLEYKEPVQ